MKPQKKKNQHQEKLSWDDMTYGEASHHIGKKMTEKTHKSKKKWDRFDDDDFYPDSRI